MELRQLQTFVRLVELGSFTRVADDLSLSQPAVTRQIATLEQELKTRLLDRLGRRVELTAEGQALYGYAVPIVRMAEEATRAVADVAAGASGRLSVGASSTAATYLLPPLLSSFSKAHPAVELNVHTGPSARIVQMVRDSAVDMGVVMNFAGEKGIAVVTLASYESVLVTYPDSDLAKHSPNAGVPATALSGEPLIVMQPGTNLRGYVDDLFAGAGVVPQVAMEMDSVEAIKKMIESRLGVSILPRLAVLAEVEAGRLVALPLAGGPDTRRPISAIYRGDKYLSAALKAFVELLRREL